MRAYGGMTLTAAYRTYALAELANKKHYDAHSGIYQTRALRDARDAGKIIRGWEIERPYSLGYMTKEMIQRLALENSDFHVSNASRLWTALYETIGPTIGPGWPLQEGDSAELFKIEQAGNSKPFVAMDIDGLEKIVYNEAFASIPNIGDKNRDFARFIISYREEAFGPTVV